jgi:nucleotide-binding universal stress UspA family protein
MSGSPKRVILEEAEAFGADLIVVGSHGYGMVERFLLGSSPGRALHASVRSVCAANAEERK